MFCLGWLFNGWAFVIDCLMVDFFVYILVIVFEFAEFMTDLFVLCCCLL